MQREDSEGYLTNLAARLFAQAMDRAIRPHGLSSAYVPVIFALTETPGMTQAELAQYAAIEQPTMAATLSRMERDGLIGRERDPADRRKVLIRLRPEAAGRVEAVARAVEAINARATAGMTRERRAALRLTLAEIAGNLAAMRLEDGDEQG